jgi:multicomponent Na+:H+ antiporter subunit D
VVERYAHTDVLAHMGGLIRRDWVLAVAFFIGALSLVGLPPTSGTFGKYLLIRASFERADAWGWILGCTLILASGLTLVAIMRVWSTAFWSSPAPGTPLALPPVKWRKLERYGAVLPLGFLVGLALVVGLFAQHFYDVAAVAARGITDPRAYVQAVLGPQAAGVDPRIVPLLPEAIDVSRPGRVVAPGGVP